MDIFAGALRSLVSEVLTFKGLNSQSLVALLMCRARKSLLGFWKLFDLRAVGSEGAEVFMMCRVVRIIFLGCVCFWWVVFADVSVEVCGVWELRISGEDLETP